MVPFGRRSSYPNTYFSALQSLSRDDSKNLLNLWLKELRTDCSEELLDDIVEYVIGHPKNIEVAARYTADVGVARINTDRATFIEVIRKRASALIENITFSEDQEKFLALFRDYQYLSADDILAAVNDDDPSIQENLGYLQDHGILEKDGEYLRLAPYLLDAVSRHRAPERIKPFIDDVRQKFLERIETLETNDYVKISVIDVAVLSALRSTKVTLHPLLERALLPSHLLRVAREFYDAQQYERTAELCAKALERSFALTRDAQIEALRLRALALARRGRDDEFFSCVQQLDKYHERVAKRNASFLRGFKQRWDGKADQAEKHYREAYSYGGDRNFHVLRELAQLLASKGEFAEAEGYARAALRIAPRNAYVIDNLLEILIEKSRDDLQGLANSPEIQALFSLLQETAKIERCSFYEGRMANYYVALRQFSTAVEWADRAAKVTPNLIPVYLISAKARIAAGKISDVDQDIRQIQKLLAGGGAGGDKRYVFELHRLTAKLHIEKKEFDKARRTIENTVDLPTSVRKALKKELASAIAYQGTTDKALVEWANKVLAGTA